jgi:hypothetical protein
MEMLPARVRANWKAFDSPAALPQDQTMDAGSALAAVRDQMTALWPSQKKSTGPTGVNPALNMAAIAFA